jgi:NADH:ubiquinone oxidoreductase subunit K
VRFKKLKLKNQSIIMALPQLPYDIADIVNVLAFIGLTIGTYTVFYFGRALNKQGVATNLFTLALGMNLIGLSHLFRIWLDITTSPLVTVTVAAGAVFLSVGVVWVFYEKSREIAGLRKREDDINAIIAKLKDKYYQQELSEEDLKNSYSDLLRELAEIEVKLSKSETEKGPEKTEMGEENPVTDDKMEMGDKPEIGEAKPEETPELEEKTVEETPEDRSETEVKAEQGKNEEIPKGKKGKKKHSLPGDS